MQKVGQGLLYGPNPAGINDCKRYVILQAFLTEIFLCQGKAITAVAANQLDKGTSFKQGSLDGLRLPVGQNLIQLAALPQLQGKIRDFFIRQSAPAKNLPQRDIDAAHTELIDDIPVRGVRQGEFRHPERITASL